MASIKKKLRTIFGISCYDKFYFIAIYVVFTCFESRKSENKLYVMQRVSQNCLRKVFTFILMKGKKEKYSSTNDPLLLYLNLYML